MPPVFKIPQAHAEATEETLCPMHHMPVIEMCGHKLCKLCVEETVHQS